MSRPARYSSKKNHDGFAQFLHFIAVGALAYGGFPFWRRGFVHLGVPDFLSWPLTIVMVVIWVPLVLDIVNEFGEIKSLLGKVTACLFMIAIQGALILLAIGGGARFDTGG